MSAHRYLHRYSYNKLLVRRSNRRRFPIYVCLSPSNLYTMLPSNASLPDVTSLYNKMDIRGKAEWLRGQVSKIRKSSGRKAQLDNSYLIQTITHRRARLLNVIANR